MQRIRIYQNAILEHYWPDAELTVESLDTSDSIAATKEYKLPSTLYHYTGIDSAVSILGGDDACGFAFSHYKFLNDRREYNAGIEIAKEWIRKRGGALLWSIQDELLAYIERRTVKQTLVPYVLSFTTEKDSIPQWMAYTDQHRGGMAIGLEFGQIEKVVEGMERVQMKDSGIAEILFAPCIYCKTPKKSGGESDVLAFEDVLDKAFSCMDGVWIDNSLAHRVRRCAGRIFQFAALVKSDDFRFEHEWRLVIRPRDNDGYARDIHFIGGKPRLKPSVLELKSCVGTIVISPHGDYERLSLLADLLRMKMGRRIKIARSKSSYCGT